MWSFPSQLMFRQRMARFTVMLAIPMEHVWCRWCTRFEEEGDLCSPLAPTRSPLAPTFLPVQPLWLPLPPGCVCDTPPGNL